MTIAGRDKLEKFMRKHANARSPLKAWLAEAEAATWENPQQIKNRFQSADFLSGNRVVFNIGGNNFRLVVLVRYAGSVVLVQKIGTHAEYEKWNLD
ncbi:MAG: type II toxin-antitoxin system HigB family toxin [Verrucomicrobiota bacterium]